MLKSDNRFFIDKLSKFGKDFIHKIYPGKTHMQMIMQLEDQENELYDELVGFINSK
ncbi:MAG TPA: hypothetical protein VFF35_00160 [Bacteroidia bacterium]|nr:hypothetical protein [Bacteroidia bacterium]